MKEISYLYYQMENLKILFFEQDYLFLPIVLATILIAVIVETTIRIYLRRFKKRKVSLNIQIVKTIERPLIALVIATGVYFTINSMSIFTEYNNSFRKVFFVFATLLTAIVISKVSAHFIQQWLKVQKKYEKTPQILNKIVSIVIYITAILVTLAHFNIDITPFLATLGLGSLAIGLALQGTMANFISGLHIISDRPFSVGDFIEVEQNISGHVEDIGWRSTKIKTLPNTIVIIPNAKLAESTIRNISLPQKETTIFVDCGVSYNSDLKMVEKITLDVARNIQKSVNGAVDSFKPSLRFTAFGDSNIDFKVVLRARNYEDQYTIKSEFIKALKERFDKEKIEISWPIRKVHLDQGTEKVL